MTDTFKEKWLVTLYNVPQVGFFDVLSLDRGYEPLTRIPQTGCAECTTQWEVRLASPQVMLTITWLKWSLMGFSSGKLLFSPL